MTSNLPKPFNLAFLGCGYAARLHSRTLSRFRQDVRCYYASRDPAKALEYQQTYQGAGHFDSYETAIDSDEIHVIFVATPPRFHLDLTLKALAAGKHVIVEKPPFLNSTDFTQVHQLQQSTGCQVLVAENYYYKPLALTLRQIIQRGDIGDILFIYVNALKQQVNTDWRQDPDLAGAGALFEGGVHWINFISHLGLTVKSMTGVPPVSDASLERSILVTVTYEEGGVGSLYHSWEIPSLFQGLRLSAIFGREGRIRFESNGLFVLVTGKKPQLILAPGITDIAGYRGMFADFIQALQTGTPPQMTWEKAQQDLHWIEKVYESGYNS